MRLGSWEGTQAWKLGGWEAGRRGKGGMTGKLGHFFKIFHLTTT